VPAVLWYWPFEPVVLLGVELAAILYLIGGIGARTERWRSVCFWLALLSILLALQSPIEILARQLFWVHMVQHLLLMVVAAPLLALASPWTRLWRALPRRWRRAIARPLFRDPRLESLRWTYHRLSNPVVIWFAAAVNLWLWHVPALYDVTLRNHAIHHLEHTLFLGLSIAFWAHVINQYPFHSRLSPLGRAVYVFLAMVQSWGLAAILSLAASPFYAYSALAWRPGGISALTDQQLGGGMMWVPGAITYSIAFVAMLFRWLAEEDSPPEPARPAIEARPTVGG
jgi:cytochrome c oxidase assembly factor CtaG